MKAGTACLNTKLKGFNIENQQSGDTPMPFFPGTPLKRNMSKEEINWIINQRSLKRKVRDNELKTETKERFESIEAKEG